MEPALRAFISYRRDDAFVPVGEKAEPDYSFLLKL
jgi:hypothetical protein